MIAKGSITPVDPPGDRIRFQFNPSNLERSKEAGWAEIGIPGLDFPIQQFVRGHLRTLRLELYLNRDHYDMEVMVRAEVGRLEDLAESQARTKAPPICVFSYGSFNFVCVVGSIGVNYSMFDEDGDPIEATVTLTLREYQEKRKRFELPSREVRQLQRKHPVFSGDRASNSYFDDPEAGAAARARATEETGRVKERVTQSGDSFQSIASEEYGDPSLWRIVEHANRGRRTYDNLRDIGSGNRFIIPDIENASSLLEDLTGFPPHLRESFAASRTMISPASSVARVLRP